MKYMQHTLYSKSGISLIAVLMFMLAATTASIVVWRQIDSENLTSGSRLKQSEAYQASESGVDAVRAWLQNRPMDAGDLIRQFVDPSNNKVPIRLDVGDEDINMLGKMSAARGQEYKVYLTGVDTSEFRSIKRTLKLKFLSVGTARDGSEVNQVAIFAVSGLYKVTASSTKENPEIDFNQAFFGGFTSNTQGKFSSAILQGNADLNGITTTGNLLVTGNLSFSDNGDRRIGCPTEASILECMKENKTREECEVPGELYVAGDFNPRGSTICGNAFVGGNMTTISLPLFRRDLFVTGDITGSVKFVVMGNMTLGGIIRNVSNEGMLVQGNLVLADVSSELPEWSPRKATNSHGNFEVTNDLFANGGGGAYGGGGGDSSGTFPTFVGLAVEGSFWTDVDFIGSNSDANRMNFAKNNSGKVYVPNAVVVNGNAWRNDGRVNFNSYANPAVITPNAGNKPTGAKNLEDLANRIKKCTRPGSQVELCVPDPLEAPENSKKKWMEAAKKLDSLANPEDGDTTWLRNNAESCLRLLRKGQNTNYNIEGKWYGCGNGSKANFTKYVNQCYTELKSSGEANDLLYVEGGESFLAVNMDGSCTGDPAGEVLKHNLIFVFPNQITESIKLGETDENAVVFLYLKEGTAANKQMAMQGSRNDGKYRNYFIFSEKDIAGMSGSTTISGAIFLANGAKSGAITDTDINFNKDLFDALVGAGILGKPRDGTEEDLICEEGQPIWPQCNNYESHYEYDPYYIPIANMLSVKIESKGISKEKLPVNSRNKLEPQTLVMPRIIYMNKLETFKEEYYTFVYMNGAQQLLEKPNIRLCENIANRTITKSLSDLTSGSGTYECTFNDAENKNLSNFFVKVSKKEGGKSEISIGTPGDDRNTITKAEIDSGGDALCRDILLYQEEGEDSDDWTVHVNVSANHNWRFEPLGSSCTRNDDRFTCFFPRGKEQIEVVKVCYLNESSPSITLTIEEPSASTFQLVSPKEVTIRLQPNDKEVIRRDIAGNTWAKCFRTATETRWIEVVCSSVEELTKNNRWRCDANRPAEWSIIQSAIPFGCEPSPENDASNFITVSATNDTYFTADLRLKAYTLTVTGGTGRVELVTYDTIVPPNERSFICNGSCNVYHGITYNVTHPGGDIDWECSLPVCDGDYLRALNVEETITTTSNVTIKLSTISRGLVSCNLKANQQVIRGEALPANLCDYVDSYEIKGCVNPGLGCGANPGNSNGVVGSTIAITMSAACYEGDPLGDGNKSLVCSGSVEVVPETRPTISCAWGNGPSAYSIGHKPVVLATVINGSVTTCANPTIKSSNFSGISANNWTRTGNAPVHTFSANNQLTALETNRSVTVEVVCDGGEYPGTYEATCSGKEVIDLPACEYTPSLCNNLYENAGQVPVAPVTNGGNGACFFATEITSFCSSGAKINNVTAGNINCWGGSENPPAKVDGGYYVYISSNQQLNVWAGTTGGAPECKVPLPESTLSCTWGMAGQIKYVDGTTVEGGSIPAPTVICSPSTNITSNINWSGGLTWNGTAPLENAFASANPYSITATVSSGCGSSSKQADCGSLSIRTAPRINNCPPFGNLEGGAGSNLSGSKPIVVLSDPSNICSSDGSTPNASWVETWSSSGGTFNWSSLPAPGTYNSFSVQGNCGQYGQIPLSANCTGSVTVTEATSITINIPQSSGGVTLTGPNIYNATLASGGNALVCEVGSPTTSDRIIGKFNDRNMTIPAYNSGNVAVITNIGGQTSAIIEIYEGYTFTCRKDY